MRLPVRCSAGLLVAALIFTPICHAGEFNVHSRIPNDLSLSLALRDGLTRLSSADVRYKLDNYIYGISIGAGYDNLTTDGGRVLHGGSLLGEVYFSPLAFFLLLIESKETGRNPHKMDRLLDAVNLHGVAGVRLGVGSDGEAPEARLAGWLGGELMLRYSEASWSVWPHLWLAFHRQLGLPERAGTSNQLLLGLGISRRISI